MRISTDGTLFGQEATGVLNDTILYMWVVMALMAIGSWLITRKLSSGPDISRWQNLLEVIVQGIRRQIREVSQQAPGRYLPFIGTLFLFIAVSNILGVVPGFKAPTGSLSTTAALALCVFVAVPLFGITQQGLGSYLKISLKPSPFMLPFNILGEVSRTLALAVRLFGNVMSGAMIGGILLSVVPIIIPTAMDLLGLLIGVIQAYVFAILAMVYIASGTRAREQREEKLARGEAETPIEKGEAADGRS
jgi:F-type H+-transporting ATPase subunit a